MQTLVRSQSPCPRCRKWRIAFVPTAKSLGNRIIIGSAESREIWAWTPRFLGDSTISSQQTQPHPSKSTWRRAKKKHQKTLPPRPVPTAVMPPSAGAVALWCRPTDEEYHRFQSSAYRSQVVTDGWSKWCWMMRLLMIYIYIYIYIYTYVRSYQIVRACVCVLMDFVDCWHVIFVVVCGMICWCPSEGMTSLYCMRCLFYFIALWLFDLANWKITMFKSPSWEIINVGFFIAISSFCCELPEGTKYDGGAQRLAISIGSRSQLGWQASILVSAGPSQK